MASSTGTIGWYEDGAALVEDEHGNAWEVVEIDGRHGILVREDSHRYYGAEWSGDGHGVSTGTLYERREGDTYEGVDTLYAFDPMRGWVEA